jgi:hypothetical protein
VTKNWPEWNSLLEVFAAYAVAELEADAYAHVTIKL